MQPTSGASCIATSSQPTSRSRQMAPRRYLDFGIAKVLEEDRRIRAREHRHGQRHACRDDRWLSGVHRVPEQARGRGGRPPQRYLGVARPLRDALGRQGVSWCHSNGSPCGSLSAEPDWTALPAATPPADPAAAATRVAQKDSRRRLRDIGDAHADLDDLGATNARTPNAPPAKRWAYILLGAVGHSGCRTDVGACDRTNRAVGTPPSVMRTHLSPPDGLALATRDGSYSLALSPDGSAIAFVVEREGQSELYAQRLSEPSPVRLAASAGSIKPFFSPDGRVNRLRRRQHAAESPGCRRYGHSHLQPPGHVHKRDVGSGMTQSFGQSGAAASSRCVPGAAPSWRSPIRRAPNGRTSPRTAEHYSSRPTGPRQ